MNKQRVIILILVVLLASGAVALWLHRPIPTTVRISLTGTAGLKVAGTVVVDGVPREFSGTLPTGVTVEARKVDYTILMQEPQGELISKLTSGDGVSSSAGAGTPFGGVRGHYSRTWGGRRTSAMTISGKAP